MAGACVLEYMCVQVGLPAIYEEVLEVKCCNLGHAACLITVERSTAS